MLLPHSPWKALAKNLTSLRYQSKKKLPLRGACHTSSLLTFYKQGGTTPGIHSPWWGLTNQGLLGAVLRQPDRTCRGASPRQPGALLATGTVESPEMTEHQGLPLVCVWLGLTPVGAASACVAEARTHVRPGAINSNSPT